MEGVDLVRELVRIEKKLEDTEKLLNELLEREESYALMKISEESLREFLADEPDIYSEEDLKVRYRYDSPEGYSTRRTWRDWPGSQKRNKPKDMLTSGV
ncbi:hypothetical protein [Thermococcus zilligii]|uniref:hypothetical protein n=1 Tax=Thermococcus zilligii TaxID=54076 RepID=UPI00029AA38B|nr:hypothetical protein [Thermococcus zilligii]